VVSLVDSQRIIVAGLPGVGKTTVVSKAVERLQKMGHDAILVTLGSFMYEEAEKLGVSDRDSIRKLPVGMQRELQLKAAKRISELSNEFVFVDTHLLIKTPQGFFPGLPLDVLQTLRPTQLVMIEAPISDIFNRRLRDGTRRRDNESEEEVAEELLLSKQFLVVAAANTGATMTMVNNRENLSDEAVRDLLKSLRVPL